MGEGSGESRQGFVSSEVDFDVDPHHVHLSGMSEKVTFFLEGGMGDGYDLDNHFSCPSIGDLP